jgi:MFS family permease
MEVTDSPKLYRVGTLTYTRAKLAVLFFWLLWGDFCYMLMETVVPSILPLKFKELGASNLTVGLIMITIPMILNSMINPIVSFKSDRYRSRWGRRIPFIVTTLPFLVLFLLGIGFSDKIALLVYPGVQKVVSHITAAQVDMGIIILIFVTIPLLFKFVTKPMLTYAKETNSQNGKNVLVYSVLPFVALIAAAVVFGDRFAIAVHVAVLKFVTNLSPNLVIIGVIGVMMTLFSVFNSFVNAVFWYLFNDVIPEELLARFMSWFRVVINLSVAFYNFFIFPYAESHALEIFIGGACIYTFGFGLMCLFVREGQYPPPPKYVDGQHGLVAAFKTYGKECFSITHYWYVFIIGICMGAMAAMGTFGLYFSLSIGLNISQIGKLAAVGNIVGMFTIVLSGWLADRYHPIRITLIGYILSTLTVPISLVWLFWHPSSQTVFYFSLVISIIFSPIGAFQGVLDPPLFMRIFPRERYGQYCSANALCRSVSSILMGLLAGIYLDVLTSYFGKDVAYKMIPLWTLFFTAVGGIFLYKLYRSWKCYGGDKNYVPPTLESCEKPVGSAESVPVSA